VAHVASKMSYTEQLINRNKITKLEQQKQVHGPSSVPVKIKLALQQLILLKAHLHFFFQRISSSINLIICKLSH
jgi:hypothetical protein